MQDLLDQIIAEARPIAAEGKVASYIPALECIDPNKFGIALVTADGKEFTSGDAEEPFSIQSISKLFALAAAMEWVGDALWEHVGREPSGMRFNSIIQLETERGRPRNPFINAGAIATTDALLNVRPDYSDALIDELRLLARNPSITYDTEVHQSEIRTGDLNRAMAFVLKANKNLHGDPIVVTNAYFRACSIEMSALDLARAAQFLVVPHEGASPISAGLSGQRIRAIMRTCGLYDQSGEFAYRVGLPGKSGVGGGILVVQPKVFSACVWSPPLDKYGNSVAGQAALELLARHLC
ncbi:glutaminase [Rhodobacteraceae bacterium NNCM2]|nr:glutaminase [Coraliihabitans acroporae]